MDRGQSSLHSEFQASQGYFMRLYFRKKKKVEKGKSELAKLHWASTGSLLLWSAATVYQQGGLYRFSVAVVSSYSVSAERIRDLWELSRVQLPTPSFQPWC